MAFPNVAQAVQNPSSLLAGIFPEPVYIGDIEVDVLTIEDAERSWTVTEYAIQQNQPISGARVKNSDTLQLTGWLTDTPPSLAGVLTSAFNALSGGSFYFSWRDKKEALQELADKDHVVKIVTRLDSYPDFTITSIKVSHTKDSARGYPFVLNARKARIVKTEFSIIDPSLIPSDVADLQTPENVAAEGNAAPTENLGSQATSAATNEDVDPLRKLAAGLGFDV